MATLTIEDIANRAGVSRSTVSRVINKSANVSAKTRARVEKAIDELGHERVCFGSDMPFFLVHARLAMYRALLRDHSEEAVGAVLGELWLIEHFGLRGSAWLAAGLDVAAAGVALALAPSLRWRLGGGLFETRRQARASLSRTLNAEPLNTFSKAG